MRGDEMPGPGAVDAYYVEIRRAIDDGAAARPRELPAASAVRAARVLERSTEETLANEYTAGIFGLAKACGAKDFALVVGRLVGDPLDTFGEWERDCEEVTFADRIDARRHFTTAAALRAASNRGVSVSVGSSRSSTIRSAGSGAASTSPTSGRTSRASGCRTSIMGGTRADLARTLEMMATEGDVLVDLARLPQIMLRGEFEARYGTIESDAYAAELARIERLIDEVTIHRPR
jgi:hypothetical protein